MDLPNYSIVLKNFYPNKQKLILLDKNLGKIECIFISKPNHHICTGTILNYLLEEKSQIYKITNYSIEYTPILLATQNIFFLHKILETTLFFSSFDSQEHSKHTFNLLCYLYHKGNLNFSINFQQLSVLKLFLCLGIFHEEKNDWEDAQQIQSSLGLDKFVDIPLNIKLELKTELLIDKLIKKLLLEHPSYNYLKTFNFNWTNNAI
ncbi:MAG: hypothetical protein UR26_C0002G0177 [candidate division TM6 bacterium GW2011_GWF2_32_72]|nr:MAG: hypothetical protein UR26_C0002G0177 [candidate division TM6 bacterium GW2011_GWF2_32_72]